MNKLPAYAKVVTAIIVAAVALAAVLTQDSFSQDGKPVFLQSWGNDVGVLREPREIAVGAKYVYVADSGNRRVQMFDHTGGKARVFAESRLGSLFGSSEISLATDGAYVYVADFWANRVLKFSAEGVYVATLGTSGDGAGEFSAPQAVAVDREGNVYVADSGKRRIQKLTGDGAFLASWDVPFGVVDIDVDGNGNVYAADQDEPRILKFANDGTLLREWGRNGTGPGEFRSLWNLAVDDAGFVYATDAWNGRVQKFTLDGVYVGEWSDVGTGPGEFNGPSGIDVDEQGNVFVVEIGNERVQKLTAAGEALALWGISSRTFGEFRAQGPRQIAVSKGGRLLAIDNTMFRGGRIQEFTSDGAFVKLLGLIGDEPGQFNGPNDVAFGPDGSIYVVECSGRVQKLTAEGIYETEWGGRGGGPGVFRCPTAIAVANDGRVYVGDYYNYRVQVFTEDGTYLTEWGSQGAGPGEFGLLQDIAVDADGYVYVVDWSDRLQKFTADGAYVTGWGESGSGPGEFDLPAAVAVDGSNNVYIADAANGRIRKFTPDGTYLVEWGGLGSGPGEFSYPAGIAIDADGAIYVADAWAYRIQKFADDYPEPDSAYDLIQNSSFEDAPDLKRWTYGSTSRQLPVSVSADGSTDGAQALLLGKAIEPGAAVAGRAWVHQTVYVDPAWERPVLSFDYRIMTNDVLEAANFHVTVRTWNGGWLANVLRDGFRSCTTPPVAPPAGYDLGWRSGRADLSAYKGETVRVRFEINNVDESAWGIWAYVDDVRVVDAGAMAPVDGAAQSYFPVLAHLGCDTGPGSR